MKVIFVCVLLMLMALCIGFSPIAIENTRADGCIDGVCGPHCSYDGVKLFPGSYSVDQPGDCVHLYCNDAFTVIIETCPFDRKKILRCDYLTLINE